MPHRGSSKIAYKNKFFNRILFGICICFCIPVSPKLKDLLFELVLWLIYLNVLFCLKTPGIQCNFSACLGYCNAISVLAIGAIFLRYITAYVRTFIKI